MGDLDDLADLANHLYALPPEDFVAARTAQAKRVRADGDRVLARRVGELPKPTVAAWLLNQLVRRRPHEVAQLVELGGELREAQRTLAGDQMRALTKQRHAAVAAFAQQSATLAAELERSLSLAVANQIEETLRAAVADEDAGRALLSGRLTTALSYVGMGEIDVSAAVAFPRQRPHRLEPHPSDRPDATDELAAARRRRLETARQGVADAEAAADRSATELEEAEERIRRLDTEAAARRARVQELQALLDGATEQAVEADDHLEKAQRARDAADEAAAAARSAVQQARAALDDLG